MVFLLCQLTFNSSVKRSILFLPLRPTLTILSSLSFSSKCNAESIALPSLPFPVPKKVPHTVSVHGLTLEDPYHWMRDINDPDFLDHLKKENFYAQAFMSDTKNLQHTLVSEMKSRMSTMVSTPPERLGPWFMHFTIFCSSFAIFFVWNIYDFVVYWNFSLFILWLVIGRYRRGWLFSSLLR